MPRKYTEKVNQLIEAYNKAQEELLTELNRTADQYTRDHFKH